MWRYNLTGELYHYGVLGMKWGVKRSGRALNRSNASDYKGKGLTVAQATRQAKIDKATAKKNAKAEKKNTKVFSKETAKKAAAKSAKTFAKVAAASLVDDVYYDGKIKKTGKQAVKAAGRAATEAYLYKHGSIEVTWLD